MRSESMLARSLRVALAATLLVGLTAVSATAVSLPDDDPTTAPALAPTPQTGSVGDSDSVDFFRLDTAGGEYLRLDLSSSSANSEIDLKVYRDASDDPSDLIVVSQTENTSNEHIEYLIPPGGGRFTIEVKPAYAVTGFDWDYSLAWSLATELTPRLAGNNRYLTSYAISRSTFTSASACVVASGASFPDALSASGLAGEINGPVLLTDANTVAPELIAEVRRLGVATVYVVGGTKVVSNAIRTELAKYVGSVVPLSGGNRYDTSYRVTQKIAQLRGVSTLPSAFVVRGDSFADALAVSPFAYSEAIPVLLTESTTLNSYASNAIKGFDIDNIFIAGGATAVSSSVAGAIDALAPVDKVERWFGSNRYATAAKVAQEGISEFGWVNGWDTIGIATGVSYPDALSGGATCGRYGGPLLLTDSSTLSGECRSAVYSHRSDIKMMVLFGGTVAVSDSVRTSLRSLIP